MHARGVVPTFDVGEHAVLSLCASGKVLPVGFFDFQRVPEAFHRSVVGQNRIFMVASSVQPEAMLQHRVAT